MGEISSNNKLVAKNTILLYIRMILLMFISLFTSRVILRVLGVEDYGIYNVVGGVVAMFGFINAAMTGSIQRYITFAIGRGDKNKTVEVFSTSLNVQILISLLVILLAETLGLWFFYNKLIIPEDRYFAAFITYQLSIFSTVCIILSAPYNASIIANEKMSAFAYISLIEAIMKLAIVYLLMVAGFDKLILYAVLLFIVQLSIQTAYALYGRLKFKECRYKFSFDSFLFREMFGFAGWNLLGSLSYMMFTQGINILLNMFFGPTVNAARAVSVQVQGAVMNFVSNFQMALNPQITKNYASGNIQHMFSLVYASSKYSFFLLFVISFPIILLVQPILNTWLTVVPEHTGNFVRLILLIMLLDSTSNPLIVTVQATGKIRFYQLAVGCLLLTIVPISYIVLKLGCDAESVYIVQAVIVLLSQCLRLMIVKRLINLQLKVYFKVVVSKIIYVLIASLILPIIYYSQFYDESVLASLVLILICILSSCLSVYFLGLTEKEKTVVVAYISKFCNKLNR